MFLKKYCLFILILSIVGGCKNSTVENKNTGLIKKDLNPKDIPANRINAWSDGCGFSFEFQNNNLIWAFDTLLIKYNRLNDSTIEIIYPSEPTIIKKISFSEGEKYLSYGNSGLGNCIENSKNEIYFGADLLKFKKLSNSSIKIFYPLKSIWRISRISDREISIYNDKNKTKYTQFSD